MKKIGNVIEMFVYSEILEKFRNKDLNWVEEDKDFYNLAITNPNPDLGYPGILKKPKNQVIFAPLEEREEYIAFFRGLERKHILKYFKNIVVVIVLK